MNIKAAVESLLFVTVKPLTVKKLADILNCSAGEVQESLSALVEEYNSRDGGLQIQQAGSSYQLVTHPDYAELVGGYLKEDITGELTQPQLETLTVIAYRGPVTKAELELIRGVNCSVILRNLLMRGLIQEKEDKQRMVSLYSVTLDFLQHLGLTTVQELPDFEVLNQNAELQELLESSETKE